VRQGFRCWTKSLTLSLALLAAAAGCAAPQQDHNPDISGLRLGMSRQAVRMMMGAPQAVENVGEVEFWLYSLGVQDHADTTEDAEDLESNVRKIGFLNGRVVGWGSHYYNDTIKRVVGLGGTSTKDE
jgi:outer membrane protein assembly factor BamE (lipoprotein component of BamABCDE complex)